MASSKSVVFLLLPAVARACTSIIVAAPEGSGAGNFILDTNDCLDCDFRAAAVGRTSAASKVRVQFTHDAYPREVNGRSPTYSFENLDHSLESAQDGNLASLWGSESWDQSLTIGEWDPLSADATAFPGMVDSAARGAETFASLEADYAMLNERSLAMGESTCACRAELNSPARPAFLEKAGGGDDGALWDVYSLTRLAMARCSTARCAMDLMGHFAVVQGYYGDPSEPGESLMVADKDEAWIWHIVPLPPSVTEGLSGDDGAPLPAYSAAWAAQRVPPGHFGTVANRFVLRTIEEGRPDDFRGSFTTTLFASAAALAGDDAVKVIKSDGDDETRRSVDWLPVFGPQDLTIEVGAYSHDRMWRVLDLLGGWDASANEKITWPWPPATATADEYPVFAPLNVNLGDEAANGDGAATAPSYADRLRWVLFKTLRDVYRQDEHPELDVSRVAAGGAFGDPSRWDALTPQEDAAVGGGFPRTISMFRTSFAYVAETGQRREGVDDDPLDLLVSTRVWFAQGVPHGATFVPLHMAAYVKAFPNAEGDDFEHNLLPAQLTTGSLHRSDLFDDAEDEGVALDVSVPPLHYETKAQRKKAQSLYWQTSFVNHWARASGSFEKSMDIVRSKQTSLEAAAVEASVAAEVEVCAALRQHRQAQLHTLNGLEAKASSSSSSSEPPSRHWAAPLATADREAAEAAARSWRELATEMMTKGHDGYIAAPDRPQIGMTKLFYPKWWLQEVGYYSYFDYLKSGAANADLEGSGIAPSSSSTTTTVALLAVVSLVVSFLSGFALALRFPKKQPGVSGEATSILYRHPGVSGSGAAASQDGDVAMTRLRTARVPRPAAIAGTTTTSNWSQANYHYGAVPTSQSITATASFA